RVTWFPPGRGHFLAPPPSGAQLGSRQRIRLVFSERAPAPPKLAAAGRWVRPDTHTLEFRPAGYGYGLAGQVRLRVGGKALRWTTAQPSELRLEQLLGLLRYIPLR